MNLHEHCLYDRQRQRQSKNELAADIDLRFEINAPTQILYLGFDHIQTHTAPGNIRDLVLRGKPG